MKNQIKSFKTLVIILSMSALVTACQKETIEPDGLANSVTTKLEINPPIDNPNRPDTTGYIPGAQSSIRQK